MSQAPRFLFGPYLENLPSTHECEAVPENRQRPIADAPVGDWSSKVCSRRLGAVLGLCCSPNVPCPPATHPATAEQRLAVSDTREAPSLTDLQAPHMNNFYKFLAEINSLFGHFYPL